MKFCRVFVILIALFMIGSNVHFSSKIAAYGLSYTASTGFSSTQGQNQWFYQYWDGSAYVDMTYDGSVWVGANYFCRVTPTKLHPDGCDAARKWVAPSDGPIRITGNVAKYDTISGDGVKVRIMKNNVQLWPVSGWQDIAYNDNIGVNVDVSTSVAVGDAIYFLVNQNVTIANDATGWDPTITYKDTTPPTTPTDFITPIQSNTTASLQWTASQDNTGIARYEVYRDGNYLADAASTTYVATGLVSGQTYAFTVLAVDTHGNKSPVSSPVTVTTVNDQVTKIYEIENLILTSSGEPYSLGTDIGASNGQWRLHNTDGAGDYVEYTINVPTAGTYDLAFRFKRLNNRGIAQVSVNGQNVGSPVDMYGASDAYAAQALGQVAFSSAGNQKVRFTVTGKNAASTDFKLPLDTLNLTKPQDTEAPSAPANLTAGTKTDSSVVLNWSASTDNVGVAGYDVYQGANLIGSAAGVTTTYTVTGLTVNSPYSFTVKARDAAGNVSAASNALNVTLSVGTAYTASSGFSSTQGLNQWSYQYWNGSAYVDMTYNGVSAWKGENTYCTITSNKQHPDGCDSARKWTAPSGGPIRITGNVAKYDVAGGDGVKVRIMKNATQLWPVSGWQSIAFNDNVGVNVDVTTNVVPGDAIYFLVNQNVGTGNDSTLWNPTITYQEINPPTVPMNLVSPIQSNTTASLQWTASVDNTGVSRYEVYRDGSYLADATSTTYVATGLVSGQTYAFTVLAVDTDGNKSDVSSPVTVTTVNDQVTKIFEIESLTLTSSGEPYSLGTDIGASSGQWRLHHTDGAGDNVEYTINVSTAGTYDLAFRFKRLNNRGIAQVSVNGQNVGSPVDMYGASDAYAAQIVGQVNFSSAGNQKVRFTVAGKNVASSDFKLPLDTLNLTKKMPDQNEPNDTYQQAIAYSSGVASGYISVSSDIDFYRFIPVSTGIYHITLLVPQDSNYDVEVLNDSQQVMGSGTNTVGTKEEVSFKATEGQPYYIKIYSAGGGVSSLPYQFQISKSNRIYEYDSGNRLRKITTIRGMYVYTTDYSYDSNGNMLDAVTTISTNQEA